MDPDDDVVPEADLTEVDEAVENAISGLRVVETVLQTAQRDAEAFVESCNRFTPNVSSANYEFASFILNGHASTLQNSAADIRREFSASVNDFRNATTSAEQSKQRYVELAAEQERQTSTQANEHEDKMQKLTQREEKMSKAQQEAEKAVREAKEAQPKAEELQKTVANVSAQLTAMDKHTGEASDLRKKLEKSESDHAATREELKTVRDAATGSREEAVESAKLSSYNTGFRKGKEDSQQIVQAASERHAAEVRDLKLGLAQRRKTEIELQRHNSRLEDEIKRSDLEMSKLRSDMHDMTMNRDHDIQLAKDEVQTRFEREMELCRRAMLETSRAEAQRMTDLSLKQDQQQADMIDAIRNEGTETLNAIVTWANEHVTPHYTRVAGEVGEALDNFSHEREHARSIIDNLEQSAKKLTDLADNIADPHLQSTILLDAMTPAGAVMVKFKDGIDEMQKLVEATQGNMTNLEAAMRTTEQQATSLEKLQAEYDQLRKTNDESMRLVQDAKDKLAEFDELRKGLDEANTVIKAQQEKIDELRKLRDHCDRSLQARRDELTAERVRYETSGYEIAEKNALITEKDNKIGDLQHRLGEWKTRAEKCEEDARRRDQGAVRAGGTPFGTQPVGEQPFGRQSFGQPFGSQPFGGQSFGFQAGTSFAQRYDNTGFPTPSPFMGRSGWIPPSSILGQAHAGPWRAPMVRALVPETTERLSALSFAAQPPARARAPALQPAFTVRETIEQGTTGLGQPPARFPQQIIPQTRLRESPGSPIGRARKRGGTQFYAHPGSAMTQPVFSRLFEPDSEEESEEARRPVHRRHERRLSTASLRPDDDDFDISEFSPPIVQAPITEQGRPRDVRSQRSRHQAPEDDIVPPMPPPPPISREPRPTSSFQAERSTFGRYPASTSPVASSSTSGAGIMRPTQSGGRPAGRDIMRPGQPGGPTAGTGAMPPPRGQLQVPGASQAVSGRPTTSGSSSSETGRSRMSSSFFERRLGNSPAAGAARIASQQSVSSLRSMLSRSASRVLTPASMLINPGGTYAPIYEALRFDPSDHGNAQAVFDQLTGTQGRAVHAIVMELDAASATDRPDCMRRQLARSNLRGFPDGSNHQCSFCISNKNDLCWSVRRADGLSMDKTPIPSKVKSRPATERDKNRAALKFETNADGARWEWFCRPPMDPRRDDDDDNVGGGGGGGRQGLAV